MVELPPHPLAPVSDRLFFHYLITHGASSRATVAAAHDFSRPTASEAATRLIDRGLIYALPKDAGASGKRGRIPSLYEISPTLGSLLTLVCEVDSVIATIYDLRGTLKVRSSQKVNWTVKQEVHDAVTEVVRSTLRQVSTHILAATISLITPINPQTQQVQTIPEIELSEDPVDFVSLLQKILDCPVHIDNHLAWSLLFETKEGVASEHKSVLSFYLGAHIGGMFSNDSQIYRGASGRTGALSYCTHGGVPMRDIIQSFGVIDNSVPIGSELSFLDTNQTVQHILSSDEHSKAAESFEIFTEQIANTITLLDPAGVVLTGPMSTNENFTSLLHQKIQGKLLVPSAVLLTSENGADAVHLGTALGAAHLGFQQLGLPAEGGIVF